MVNGYALQEFASFFLFTIERIYIPSSLCAGVIRCALSKSVAAVSARITESTFYRAPLPFILLFSVPKRKIEFALAHFDM